MLGMWLGESEEVVNKRQREMRREIRQRARVLFGHHWERPEEPIETGEGWVIDGWFRLQVQQEMAKKRKKRGWQP
jgi:hypothetical protein